MKIVITGGTGFLGRLIAEGPDALAHEIIDTTRTDTATCIHIKISYHAEVSPYICHC